MAATTNDIAAAMLTELLNDVRKANRPMFTRAAKPPINRYKKSCIGIGALGAL